MNLWNLLFIKQYLHNDRITAIRAPGNVICGNQKHIPIQPPNNIKISKNQIIIKEKKYIANAF